MIERVTAATALLLLAACTSWGTYDGTQQKSMWDRPNAAGAMGPAPAGPISD